MQVFSRYDTDSKNRKAELRDSVKVGILEKLVLRHVDSDPETAMSYAQQILQLSREIGYHSGIGYGHLAIGGIYNRRGDHDEAISEFYAAVIIGCLLVVSGFTFVTYRSLRRNKKQWHLIEVQKSILESHNGLIQQSLTGKDTLLCEILHYVKNNLQIHSCNTLWFAGCGNDGGNLVAIWRRV